jgi:hypothetical protein
VPPEDQQLVFSFEGYKYPSLLQLWVLFPVILLRFKAISSKLQALVALPNPLVVRFVDSSHILSVGVRE